MRTGNMQQVYTISILRFRLLCNFIEIALRHGCFTVNLLRIFRKHFNKNTIGALFPKVVILHWILSVTPACLPFPTLLKHENSSQVLLVPTSEYLS